jgi:hypothetical protein
LLTGYSFARRGAVQGVVMQQKRHAVSAEFDIALKHAVAVAGTQFEGGEGVFRGEFASASVGNPARIRPVFRIDGVHTAII